MVPGTLKRRFWLALLLFSSGCLHPVRHDVDAIICDLAAHPLDVQTPAQTPPVEHLPDPTPAMPAQRQSSPRGTVRNWSTGDTNIEQMSAWQTSSQRPPAAVQPKPRV